MVAVANHDDSSRQSSEDQPQAQTYVAVDLKGRPVDKSRTGTWKSAPFLFAVNIADFQTLAVPVNLVPYLTATLHQPISKAANIVTNLLGTSYIVAILGGFLADSYFGSFYTICVGGVIMLLGLGLLTFTAAYHGLQPAPCSTNGPCKPAGAHYMAPLFVALYATALGTGLVKPNTVSFGGDQFDDSSPKERKQGVSFFTWFYYSVNVALLITFTLGVYLQDIVSRSWGYGFALMFYFVLFLFFILGVTKYRHKVPTGSFLTRNAQVLVASLRKYKHLTPADPQELYKDPTTKLSMTLSHTRNLRFFDKAAVIDEVDKEGLARGQSNPWRLCSVAQVEELKRLIQVLPVWITTAPLTLIFSQMSTFVVQQGATLDRRLGRHFVIPPASLITLMVISSLVCVPIFEKLLVPFVRRYTRTPYGFTPLQRLGTSIVFAIITMVCSALVERKRLTYVRDMHLQALPLGAYALPMTFWYLLPQFFAAAQVEFFLYVPSYQFFYHEAGDRTRSIASSFTYSASALGYFFSTVIVDITNSATSNYKNGSWLKEDLNNGGLEKFYWLLAVFLGADLILFVVAAYFYQYKYKWYYDDKPQGQSDDDSLSLT